MSDVNIVKCTRCHASFEDMRIEVHLRTEVARRRSDLEWEKIANLALQSREVLCPECFNKFTEALEALNTKMARKDTPATAIFSEPDQPEFQVPEDAECTPSPQPFAEVHLDPNTPLQPFDVREASCYSSPASEPNGLSERHSFTKQDLVLPREDKPITFTESLHPPVEEEVIDPNPDLDEDPTIDQLLANIRYADEPIREDRPEAVDQIQAENNTPIRPLGIPRHAVHTSTTS